MFYVEAGLETKSSLFPEKFPANSPSAPALLPSLARVLSTVI